MLFVLKFGGKTRGPSDVSIWRSEVLRTHKPAQALTLPSTTPAATAAPDPQKTVT